MKLKLARNSLFAVLLRSPWWISLIVALLFVAAAYAWLPAPYRLLGAMASAPFWVIAAVAAWQQSRRPSARRSEEILRAVSAMSWQQFSTALEQGFARQGYAVERANGAADFALSRGGRTTLVSARRWKAARHGEDSLQTLHSAARAGGADCLYVALGELSANARSFASRNQVQLMQGPALASLLRDANLTAPK